LRKNLVLTGMMGVGKSTIGKSLSIKLKMNLFDVDKIIENKENMAINEIFKLKGEEYFRKIEKQISLVELKRENSVIALGGGAFIDSQIRGEVLKKCTSFWLDLSVDNLTKRLLTSYERPLLKKNNLKEELNNLLDKRREKYSLANFRIDCNNVKKVEIVDKIRKLYESN
tara:strand:- start:3315 stop:3824 length:510 start_codon:yes stop_codon:yes gene_type:complete